MVRRVTTYDYMLIPVNKGEQRAERQPRRGQLCLALQELQGQY
jgi:hypothetical protein